MLPLFTYDFSVECDVMFVVVSFGGVTILITHFDLYTLLRKVAWCD